MEFFNHVQNLYTETDHDTLNLDIPMALFMIKLLSIKSNLINFIPEYKFKSVAVVDVTNLEYLKNMGYSEKESTQALIQNGNSYDRAANWLFRGAPDYSINREFKEYMESDSPLKLRYYLQVTFREEITKATYEVIKEKHEENKYIEECYTYKNGKYYDPGTNPIIQYGKRTELYEKYLKDKDFDKDIQDKINVWIKPDTPNKSINRDMIGIINMEVNKKYGYNPEQTKNNIIRFMNRFSDKESVEKLLYSMRDVYILGLI